MTSQQLLRGMRLYTPMRYRLYLNFGILGYLLLLPRHHTSHGLLCQLVPIKLQGLMDLLYLDIILQGLVGYSVEILKILQ
mmetsp:Transcript_19646/g.42097  ORF Transcript_19646/g.42097 Transcript_19646/m.42097 type:complete len:80 (-) Transcript_19646:261-500(-)